MPAKLETVTACALVPWLLAAGVAIAGATGTPSPGFTVETLAPGVHALVRSKAPGFFLDSNVLFVVGDDDVLSVFEDRRGDLWVGTFSSGLSRLRRGAVLSYGAPEGLDLTRFRGHIILESKGVHDATKCTAVLTRIPAADDRAGPGRA